MKPCPVIWKAPRRITHPALAMPCGTCGAEIGRHCTTSYSAGDPREPHRDRREAADYYGFRWAPGAAPSSEPAYLAELLRQPEPTPDTQPSLF